MSLGIISFVTYTYALAFTSQVNQKYYLGDGDSRVSARETLVNQLKLEVASRAGTYIQSEQKIGENGEFSESVTSLSASLVKVLEIQEQYGADEKGVYLQVDAKMEVDESELRRRIEAVQVDASKAAALNELQKENQLLIAEMSKLKKALSDKQLTLQQASELIKKQSDISQRIERNEAAASSVFARGTLFSMAQQKANQEKQIAEAFSSGFYELWEKESSEIRPEIHSVNGNEVVVVINQFRPYARMSDLWKDHVGAVNFSYSNLHISPYEIKRMEGRTKEGIRAISPFISKTPVLLEVEIAGISARAPIFGFFETGFFADRDPLELQYDVNLDRFYEAIFGNGYSKSVIGFMNKESSDVVYWYVKADSIYFKFNLTDEKMNSADRINARYVF